MEILQVYGSWCDIGLDGKRSWLNYEDVSQTDMSQTGQIESGAT